MKPVINQKIKKQIFIHNVKMITEQLSKMKIIINGLYKYDYPYKIELLYNTIMLKLDHNTSELALIKADGEVDVIEYLENKIVKGTYETKVADELTGIMQTFLKNLMTTLIEDFEMEVA